MSEPVARPRMLDAALGYARHGWPVMPLHTPTARRCSCVDADGCGSPGKHPRTRHGLTDATTDLGQVRRWWGRWPDANIGVATGTAAGLLVVDVDLPDGPASLQQLQSDHQPLPATLVQETGSGGSQLLFTSPSGGARNRTRFLPGIDVRGDGGYVVVPPSLHATGRRYRWVNRQPRAAAPSWLIDVLDRPLHRPPPAVVPAEVTVALGPGATRAQRYAAVALERELTNVLAQTPDSHNRNSALYQAAYALGRLAAGGLLDRDQVARQLTGAGLTVGLGQREVDRTIVSGLDRAAARPRTAADLPPPPDRDRPWRPSAGAPDDRHRQPEAPTRTVRR